MKIFNNTLRFYIVVFLLVLTTLGMSSSPLNAKLRDFETTRLMSTSGAGIGSVLLNEATVLNPASIYFFQESSLYYQKGDSRMDSESPERVNEYKDGDNQAFILTDTSSPLKGGLSYQTQEEDGDSRKRITSSAASNMGKNASVGILYKYTEEDVDEHRVYHQATFGATYVYNKRLILGAILVDPFLANREDTRFSTGLQYMFTENLLLIGDTGANYTEDTSEENFWRAAAQAQFFGNFFLRYGVYEDNISDLRGNSWGLSWIGPRLALEYAYKKSEAFKTSENYFKGEELEDHSLALSVIFK